MSDETIHLSYHELVTTTHKTLEALGFRRSDSIDAAETVAWQEQHGLNGVEELAKSLGFLWRETEAHLEVVYEGGCWRVYNAHGASILSVVGIALDASVADVQSYGLAMTRIEACHNRALIGGYLNRCARRGLAAMAYWRNRRDANEVHALCVSPELDFPTLRIYQSTPLNGGNHDLVLMLSSNLECWPRQSSDGDSRIVRFFTPEDMRRAHEASIENGLNVNADAWHKLCRLSSGVLVPEKQ